MDSGLGGRHEFGNHDQCNFGNNYSLEANGSKGGISHCNRNEHDFNVTDGNFDERGGLRNDGSPCNYPVGVALYFGCGFSRRLALQLLAFEKIWKMLPLRIS